MKILDIYMTELCNLNCEYCYVEIKKKEFDGFVYKEFVEKIDLLAYDRIKFYGGEPLLKYQEIKKIIEWVHEKNKDIQFTLITNGLLLSKEKLDFFHKYRISLCISLHEIALKKLFQAPFLRLLLNYQDIIGFLILFSSGKENSWVKIFHFLHSLWFHTFSFTPISNDNRNDLTGLKGGLKDVFDTIVKHPDIQIADVEWKSIKNVDRDNFCRKNQVDMKWVQKACNRFHEEAFVTKKENIYAIHKLFNEVNTCDSCKDRWFCTCPIGWYLDNKNLPEAELRVATKSFHHLNQLFIDFHRDIATLQKKSNFLSRDIDEIRLNLTEQCNLRCKYCYLDFQNNVLEVGVGKNIIDFYLEQDGKDKTLSFFWWEPLLEFQLLEILVEYAHIKAQKLGKNLTFKIATNGILFSEKILLFLKKYDFRIHISLNGEQKSNDITRDSSTEKLLPKIELCKKICGIESITILFAIHPETVENLFTDLIFIKNQGFRNILIEMVLEGGKSFWNNWNFEYILHEMKRLKDSHWEEWMNILNGNLLQRKVLDISTWGIISENSFEFFWKKVDFSPKKILDKIVQKVFT